MVVGVVVGVGEAFGVGGGVFVGLGVSVGVGVFVGVGVGDAGQHSTFVFVNVESIALLVKLFW